MGAPGFSYDLPDDTPVSGVRRVIRAQGCEILHGSCLWEMPVHALPYARPALCLRIAMDAPIAAESVREILSRTEWERWANMRAVEKRRQEWILGRSVAKHAVRLLLERHSELRLLPAEIEIVPDNYGRPLATGSWSQTLSGPPAISIAHSDGNAVALAVLDPAQSAGVDLENVSRRREHFESIAFRPEERALVEALPEEARQEWALRIWCAKEAVGKALGRGLSAGLKAFEVTNADTGTGEMHVELRDQALIQFPSLAGKPFVASTTREDDFVFATIICCLRRAEP